MFVGGPVDRGASAVVNVSGGPFAAACDVVARLYATLVRHVRVRWHNATRESLERTLYVAGRIPVVRATTVLVSDVSVCISNGRYRSFENSRENTGPAYGGAPRATALVETLSPTYKIIIIYYVLSDRKIASNRGQFLFCLRSFFGAFIIFRFSVLFRFHGVVYFLSWLQFFPFSRLFF